MKISANGLRTHGDSPKELNHCDKTPRAKKSKSRRVKSREDKFVDYSQNPLAAKFSSTTGARPNPRDKTFGFPENRIAAKLGEPYNPHLYKPAEQPPVKPSRGWKNGPLLRDRDPKNMLSPFDVAEIHFIAELSKGLLDINIARWVDEARIHYRKSQVLKQVREKRGYETVSLAEKTHSHMSNWLAQRVSYARKSESFERNQAVSAQCVQKTKPVSASFVRLQTAQAHPTRRI